LNCLEWFSSKLLEHAVKILALMPVSVLLPLISAVHHTLFALLALDLFHMHTGYIGNSKHYNNKNQHPQQN